MLGRLLFEGVPECVDAGAFELGCGRSPEARELAFEPDLLISRL